MSPVAPTPPPADNPRPSHRILSKLAYVFSARWLRDGLMAVFLIYLARTDATTYGEFMMALGLGSILLFIAEFGLNLPLVGLVARTPAKTADFVAQTQVFKAVTLLCALLGAVIFVWWQGYSFALTRIVLLIGAGVALEALASTMLVIYQVQGRQAQESKIRAGAAVLGFGYGLLALALGASPLTVAWFKIIETLAIVAASAWFLVVPAASPWKWPSLKKLVDLGRLGLIFGIIEITASIYNKANLFFLQKYGGADGVAQYSATWQLVDGIAVLVSGLLLKNILYPLFVQLWETDRPAVLTLTRNTARWLLVAALGAMFVLFIEADRLLLLIYGDRYQPAVDLQKYLVVTILFAFFHNLAAFVMISMKKEKLLLGFYLTGLVINLLVCSLLIPAFPLAGAAWSIVLTKGGVACLTVSYVQLRLRFLPLPAVAQALAAFLGGLALYLLLRPLLPREAAEILALLPLLVLAWRWWQARPRK